MTKKTSKKPPKKSAAPPVSLDLGLSGLVKEPQPGTDTSIKERLSSLAAKRGLGADAANDSAAMVGVVSSFQTLAKRGAWQELMAYCEQVPLETAELSLAAKIWWIRSQLELNEMPLLALAAPLEGAVAKLKELKEGGPLDPELTDLTVVLLDRAAQGLYRKNEKLLAARFWERAYQLGGFLRPELHDLLREQLQECRRRVKSRGTKRDAERLSELEALLAELVEGDESQGVPSQNSFAAAGAGRRTYLGRRWLGGATIAIVLLLGLFRYFSDAPEEYSSDGGALLYQRNAYPKMVHPEFPRESDTLKSGLRGILTQLEQAPQVQSAGIVAAPDGPKGGVDTSGPIEPAELRAMRQRGPARQGGGRPQSVIDQGLDALGLDPRQQPIARGYQLPGGIGSTEREAQVQVSGWVRAEASDGAAGLQALQPGDLVRVVERSGNWYKILSNSGRVGYVRVEVVRPSEGD